MMLCQCLVWLCPNREMEGNQALNNFKVGSLPTLIYIPDFIKDNEETMLLNNVTISLSLSLQCFIFPLHSQYAGFILLHRFMMPLYRSGNL